MSPHRGASGPGTSAFPRSAPETQGIRSSAVLAFVEAADREIRHLHGFVLLRRGAVVAEGYRDPYRAADPHVLFSLSKSFTSTAIGMLVAEGRLTVEDPVRVECGYGRWVRGEADIETAYRRHLGTQASVPDAVVASGAWTDDDTYVAELWWYRTPFRRTLMCRFSGDRLRVDQQANLSFGPTERPRLEGRVAAVAEGDRR